MDALTENVQREDLHPLEKAQLLDRKIALKLTDALVVVAAFGEDPGSLSRTVLVAYANGESISSICKSLGTYRRKVERLVDKALELGPVAALDDLKRRGRPPKITQEARAWFATWSVVTRSSTRRWWTCPCLP
jgi:ParB-like chromosome segregation protein Spo0J